MAAPSVTYTFTNGTTADATQVNTNFTDLISGLSDGTKDLTINNLSMNGALTVNGAVTLGNASGDAITITGSIASSISVSANDTYDFGSSTLAMRSFYLGSGTRSIRLIAGAVTGTYTLTLPPAAPAVTGKTFISDTNGTLEFRYADKFTASKTTTYTATGDETIIPCNASGGAFTVTLPAAASYTGKELKIVKTDSSVNAVTIDGNSSETISGSADKKLHFQYESITVACDGTGWHVTDRFRPKNQVSFTPTGSWSSNTTYSGTYQYLSGNILRFQFKVSVSGAPTAASLTLNLPNSWNVDEASMLLGSTASFSEFAAFNGWGVALDQDADNRYNLMATYRGTTTQFNVEALLASATYLNGNNVTQLIPMTWANGDDMVLVIDIPILEIDKD